VERKKESDNYVMIWFDIKAYKVVYSFICSLITTCYRTRHWLDSTLSHIRKSYATQPRNLTGGSTHAQKMSSLTPLYLPAGIGVLHHPSIFHTNVNSMTS
jgi:hypothetical protein